MARKEKEGSTTEQKENEKEKPEGQDAEPVIPNPCVYCGPSVRGVVQQYTTFHGGLPGPVEDFIREHPEVAGLITTPEKFAPMRKRLETFGSAERALYLRVKEAIRGHAQAQRSGLRGERSDP